MSAPGMDAILRAMPVHHFTFHAYRSWNADHPDGYHQRGEPGLHMPNPPLAERRNYLADQAAVLFSALQQNMLIDFVRDACARRGWRVHGVLVDPTHLHLVVSWRDQRIEPEQVWQTLKRALGYLLAQAEGTRGRRWFLAGKGDEAVTTVRHLRYLLEEYLSKHQGIYWREPG